MIKYAPDDHASVRHALLRTRKIWAKYAERPVSFLGGHTCPLCKLDSKLGMASTKPHNCCSKCPLFHLQDSTSCLGAQDTLFYSFVFDGNTENAKKAAHRMVKAINNMIDQLDRTGTIRKRKEFTPTKKAS